MQTSIYKMDKQQGPSVEHRELYSIRATTKDPTRRDENHTVQTLRATSKTQQLTLT